MTKKIIFWLFYSIISLFCIVFAASTFCRSDSFGLCFPFFAFFGLMLVIAAGIILYVFIFSVAEIYARLSILSFGFYIIYNILVAIFAEGSSKWTNIFFIGFFLIIVTGIILGIISVVKTNKDKSLTGQNLAVFSIALLFLALLRHLLSLIGLILEK